MRLPSTIRDSTGSALPNTILDKGFETSCRRSSAKAMLERILSDSQVNAGRNRVVTRAFDLPQMACSEFSGHTCQGS